MKAKKLSVVFVTFVDSLVMCRNSLIYFFVVE